MGTARMGNDPTTSVLNSHNQAHDVQNLFVTDASAFPTSAGVNPSLTIAANALRIGARIAHLHEDAALDRAEDNESERLIGRIGAPIGK